MYIYIDGTYSIEKEEKEIIVELEDGSELAQKYLEYYPNACVSIEEDGKIEITEVIPKPLDNSFYESLISNLKKELESEDYKIIKCYEASLTSKELPYDINELSEKRQNLRNEIKELENHIQ